MPFLKRGMKVECLDTGLFGKVLGANRSMNVNVRINDTNHRVNRHPQWQMRYYDSNDKIIAEYRD